VKDLECVVESSLAFQGIQLMDHFPPLRGRAQIHDISISTLDQLYFNLCLLSWLKEYKKLPFETRILKYVENFSLPF
jgi:hypothetical protein